MSVDLSHRLARVAHQPPIIDIPHPERRALWLACERASVFEELSEHHRHLILNAEISRERAIEAIRERQVASAGDASRS